MGRRRGLALAALVALGGHQAALLAGREASTVGGLQATDHPVGWSLAVMLMLAVTLAVAFWIAWHVVALRLRLAAVPALRLPRGGTLLAAWSRLLGASLLAFLLQENLEHAIAHGHVPLLDALLSGQYQAALPIFAGLSLLVAVGGLVVGTRLRDLHAAAARTRSVVRRPPRLVGNWRDQLDDRRLRTRMATALSARRGPPVSVLV